MVFKSENYLKCNPKEGYRVEKEMNLEKAESTQSLILSKSTKSCS
jgi:hypothetical protein